MKQNLMHDTFSVIVNKSFIAFFLVLALCSAIAVVNGATHQIFMTGLSLLMVIALANDNHKIAKK